MLRAASGGSRLIQHSDTQLDTSTIQRPGPLKDRGHQQVAGLSTWEECARQGKWAGREGKLPPLSWTPFPRGPTSFDTRLSSTTAFSTRSRLFARLSPSLER